MKIGFVVPRQVYYEKAKAVMEEDYPQHKAEYLLYDNYTDSPDLLRDRQKTFDAVIFGGVAPMQYTGERLPQETIWSAIPKSSSALLRALMEAEQRGWNLARISFDSYSRDFLREVYEEIGCKTDADFEHFSTGILSHEASRNESGLEFHTRIFTEGKIDGCITVLYWVHKKLSEMRIPCILAYPPKNSIRQQVEFVMQLHAARNSLPENIAVCLISIDFPAEYSVAHQSDYQFMVERTNILKQVYRFSEQLKGTVVELSPREFMILSTREVIEIATEKYQTWEIIDWMHNNSLQAMSIGVGCGSTVADARKNAGKAMMNSLKFKKNSAHVLADPEKITGPFFGKKESAAVRNFPVDPNVDEKLLKIADRSHLSVNTVQKIYYFVKCLQHGRFLPKELSDFLNLSRRSTDRILEKLEESGYAFVAGRRMNKSSGRPARIMQILFDGPYPTEDTEKNEEC